MLIAGNNLFGQWQAGSNILDNFDSTIMSCDDRITFKHVESKLIHAGWSYNIFLYENQFYVTGSWKGEENQVVPVKLPDECKDNLTRTKLMMVGNDFSIMLIDTISPNIWLIDLENDGIKKINFATEKPLDNITDTSKRHRKNVSINKVVITNISGLLLTADGQVYCGLLPSLLDTSHCEGKVIDVQCGYEHFVLLTDIGKLYTWGNGRRLQLGHNDIISLELPTLVEALDGIKITKVRTGGWHTLALSEYGDLYAWGWNDIGQLGIKPMEEPSSNQENSTEKVLKSQPAPALVDFYDNEGEIVSLNVRDIACGTRHSAALLEDDSLWTTGNNKYGQCGLHPAMQIMVNHFKKVYQCKPGYSLSGGPWATILRDLENM